MAGINQHTIPRFLLNGFASRTREVEAYVWLYRKGNPAVEANTKKVGAERYFYGRAGELNVDEKITAVEPRHAELLTDLREHTPMSRVDDDRVPALISHLSLRTSAFREAIGDAVRYAMEEFWGFARSDEMVAKLLDSPMLRDHLRDELTGRGLDTATADILIARLEPELPTLIKRAIPNSVPSPELLTEFLKSDLRQTIRNAHIKSPVSYTHLTLPTNREV